MGGGEGGVRGGIGWVRLREAWVGRTRIEGKGGGGEGGKEGGRGGRW